jgi:hypothetical protein
LHALTLPAMRSAVLATAALCSFRFLVQTGAENVDWHIGCETSGKSSYYQDDKTILGYMAPRRDIATRNDGGPLPDFEYFDTRCKPDRKDDIIERFNGTHWVNLYICFPAGSCSDLQGHGACNTEPNIWVVPGKSFVTTFECDEGGVHGKCTQTGAMVPLPARPTTRKRESNDFSRNRKTTYPLVDNGFHPAQSKRDLPPPTRCHPFSDKMMQYWHGGLREWFNFHWCSVNQICIDVAHLGQAGCLGDGMILFPPSIPNSVESESDESDDASTTDDSTTTNVQDQLVSGKIQTRCNPADFETKVIQYLSGNDWQNFYSCGKICIQLPDFAACHQDDGQNYFVPVPTLSARTLRARGNFNTRCNPRSRSEVQRFNGEQWVHLYTCKSMETCRDFNGHGHCHAQSPAYVATKCSSNNESEIVEWNGRSWGFSGVCLPPYICEDVSAGVEFAVCKHPNGRGDDIWLPSPYLASNGSSGVITRCFGLNELFQFNGKSWVPYRYCGDGFICEPMKDTNGAENGGCVAKGAPALKKVTAAHARRAMAVHENPAPYEPFGFDHRSKMPEATDAGLIKNTEKIVFQGEGLINEGNDMVEYGNALYRSLYGPGSAQAKNKASPDQVSGLQEGSTSSHRRRSEQGLIEDSVGMRHQGEHLVKEGKALVEQGRQLLRTIFGEETDSVVNGMANSNTTSAKAKLGSQQTGTNANSRGFDPSNRDDDPTMMNASCRRACNCGAFPTEECDKECRECIMTVSDTSGEAIRRKRSVRRNCVKECQCDAVDVVCWANCHDCTGEDRRSSPAIKARHACDEFCRKCESFTGKHYEDCWQVWKARCHTCVMGDLYGDYPRGLQERGYDDEEH